MRTYPQIRINAPAGQTTKKVTRDEASIHTFVCDYLKLQHPGVIFRTDFAAGIKMTMFQAAKHKRMQSSRAYPDLFIIEPRGGFAGLFLELKREGKRIWLKNGQLSTDQHVREQAAMLESLRSRGFKAEFAIGFDDAVAQIDAYLKDEV